MVIFAALSAAAAIFVAVFTLASPGRARVISSRLNRYERESASDRDAALAAPFVSRVAVPTAKRIQRALARLLPTSIVSGLERRLLLAGEPTSLHGFLALQLAATAAAILLAAVGLARLEPGLVYVPLVLFTLLIGVSPLYWLRLRVLGRKNALLKALPDAVDLIVTTVEAGMGIDGALAEVGRETQGPLGEELRLAVRETTLGRSRRDALQRMSDRTDVPEIKTFLQAIIQAEQTGIPIGQVLRTQAAQVRLKKRQRAEAEAQRAPVKMVVVLVLLVLPAMLILVIGPAIMRMSDRL